jgi:Putative Flp pilus-assembly TadE/G-like
MRVLGQVLAQRRGSVMVMYALLAVPVLMATGAAVDYARLEQFKTQLQQVVDSAALAGAADYSNAASVAQNYLTVENALLPGHIGTITSNVAASNNSVTVNATGSLATTFMRLIAPSIPVSASATAVDPGSKVCILVLDPSDSQSFLVNGGASLNAPNCMIDVASTSSSAAMIDSSLTNITGLCIKGGATVNGGAAVTNMKTGCATISDPYANTIPAPAISTACNFNGANYNGNATLTPGTYCGNINFNGGTITFHAGNYVFYNATFNFNGSGTLALGAGVYAFQGTHWNLNSGWSATGSGVTFYYADSSSYIQFNSNVTVNLAAPTSGTYANVLMFEPDGLSTSSFAIDGTSTGHLLQGLIYLPSRNITFNSSSNVTTDGLTLVVNQVIFDTMTLNVAPSPNAPVGGSGGTPYLAM